MDGKRKTDREPKKLYEDKIISIGKVTKVTQGGRNFRFSATVAVGDRKGKVGIGTGKSKEIPVAVSKAIKEAEKKFPESGCGDKKKMYVIDAVKAKCKELGIPYDILKKLINVAIDKVVKDYNIIAK